MQQPRKPGKGSPDKGGADDGAAKSAEPLHIESHRDLAVKQGEIFARFNAKPELSTLLFINPVLAFEEVGVTLSSEMQHHVLHTRQHPPEMRKRRDELEAKLAEQLKEPPRPEDPKWVASLLFEKWKVKPLETKGASPAYVDPLPADAIKRLQALRPKTTKKYPQKRRNVKPVKLEVRTWNPAVRRLDLNAPAPKLAEARTAPAAVTLEELWFYRDAHKLVSEVLELGVIRRRGARVYSGDTYRKIKSGEMRNSFREWFKSISFKERPKK